MAEYPTLSFVDLAQSTGLPIGNYDPQFSAIAISQATLLFKIATCLTALPAEDTVQYELAKAAIIALANQIVMSQPYQQTLASPFTSESIGSYSYSKMAQQIQSKERTGVMWFDLAVSELSVCDSQDQAFYFGGVEIFEHDAKYTSGSLGEGNIALFSEADQAKHRYFSSSPGSSDPYKPLE